MLVITRKSGESLNIGDATVTLHYEKGQIKVVIDAPREVEVVRSEILEKPSEA